MDNKLIPPKSSIVTTTSPIDNLIDNAEYDNVEPPNIVVIVSSGKIISANTAACKLLGYSKKELVNKRRAAIVDLNDSRFKKMLKQRKANGHSRALVTMIRKSGRRITCLISSTLFKDEDGIEKAITMIADMSQIILMHKNIETERAVHGNVAVKGTKQKKSDTINEKIVSENIALAISKQIKLDALKEKIVADNIAIDILEGKQFDSRNNKIVAENIAIALAKQKVIDIKNKRIVAENIAIALAKQKVIDTKNKKVVADNIANALAKQKAIDTKKEKIVAENIANALAKQKGIDVKKEKIVADNIAIALAKQKGIDIKKEKIVADNIIQALAKSEARIAENSKWIKHIAKTSYDVMWDWDIATNEIYVGESITEVFGYKVKKSSANFAHFISCLLPEEKDRVKKKLWKTLASGNKSWKDTFKLIRGDSTIASAASRARIIRDENGIATRLIGALKDISRLNELEKKLKEQVPILQEHSEKFLLAAKLSFDVIWDWDLLTNEIFIGDQFKQLFGYNLKNNKGNLADWIDHLHPDDKESVEKDIYNAIASSSASWEHAYRFIRADGSIAKVFDRGSIIRDGAGKALRMIGAMQDLSRQKELEEILNHEISAKEKLLEENNERFRLIFNSSSDVLYDSDLITGNVIISDAYEKEYGYKIKSNMTPAEDWVSHIHPDDKEAVYRDYQKTLDGDDNEWKYSYRFLKADSAIADVVSNAVILRDANGKAYRMIGSMLDMGKQKIPHEMQKLEFSSNAEDKENFRQLFNSSQDILFDVDVEANEVIFSNAYEREFGYKITAKMTPEKDWAVHIHPDDKEAVIQAYKKGITSDEIKWKYNYRFLRSDNSVATILSSGIILRNADGKVYRLLGVMHDISKEILLEEKLEKEIYIKEKQITAAMEEAKESERLDIGKELHDNVNQLLGASRLFLDIAKRGGEDSEMYINRSSEYTLTAIEEIRKLTKGLITEAIQRLGLRESIENIARDTMEAYPLKIRCSFNSFIEDRANHKFNLNVFRIVQEQLNNILKHAKATNVTISLSQNQKSIILAISDNGIGFDTSKKSKGIGIDNIKSRAAAYRGTAEFNSQPGMGCELKITFLLPEV